MRIYEGKLAKSEGALLNMGKDTIIRPSIRPMIRLIRSNDERKIWFNCLSIDFCLNMLSTLGVILKSVKKEINRQMAIDFTCSQ